MERKPSSRMLINERRDYFRIEDTVLLRYHQINESCALANNVPRQFEDDPAFSLMHELQLIDTDNNKYIRALTEQSIELEAYIKNLNKKVDLIAAKLVEREEGAPDQVKLNISISEGGLSFHSDSEIAHGSHLAIQLTFLPSQHALVLFCKVINCTREANGFAVALSFVNLKDYDRQYIAKHIMQLQLAQRRQDSSDETL